VNTRKDTNYILPLSWTRKAMW